MRTIVFAGPSLAGAERLCFSNMTHAPPVKRGDLTAVDDYDTVVIIDGEFGQSDSVSPKEILAVIRKGMTVIGAASMGALRASELDRSGMIGVGWVYDYFRGQAVRRDADVALAYSSFDFTPLTVPIVDVAYWMEQALAAGSIDRRKRTLVLKAARSLFFAERTINRLMDVLRTAVGEQVLEALLASGGGTIPSIKSQDAELAIRRAVSLSPSSGEDCKVG